MKTILIVFLLLICSCSKSEVITQREIETKALDSTYKHRPHKPKDTTDKYLIRFDVHITDWEDENV